MGSKADVALDSTSQLLGSCTVGSVVSFAVVKLFAMNPRESPNRAQER